MLWDNQSNKRCLFLRSSSGFCETLETCRKLLKCAVHTVWKNAVRFINIYILNVLFIYHLFVSNFNYWFNFNIVNDIICYMFNPVKKFIRGKVLFWFRTEIPFLSYELVLFKLLYVLKYFMWYRTIFIFNLINIMNLLII